MYLKGSFSPNGSGVGNSKPDKIRAKYISLSDKSRRFNSGAKYSYDRYCKNGTPIETLTKSVSPASAVLFLHGGGFYCQITDYYRRQMKFFIKDVDAIAVMPDYGVMPEAKFPSQLEEIATVYQDIYARFTGNVMLVGDGVGAGLALSLCLKLKAESLPLPKGILCIQPFLDMTLSGDSVYDHFYFDKSVGNYTVNLPDIKEELLQNKFFEYLNGSDPTHPLVSPVFGDFDGSPKTLLVCGDRSLFQSDADRLYDKMKEQGVDVKETLFDGKYGAYPVDRAGAFKDKKVLTEFIKEVLGGNKKFDKVKRQRRERIKRSKIVLDDTPIEPQDEDVLFGLQDGSDVLYDDGKTQSFIDELSETHNDLPDF